MAHVEALNGDGVNGAPVAPVPAVKIAALKPQLFVEAPKANDAIQFYKTVFGAEELGRTLSSKRKAEQEVPLILYAELKLGSSVFLVSDLSEDSSAPAKPVSASPFWLETDDVDAAIAAALAAGAAADGEVVEGEGNVGRMGKVKDPFGNAWTIYSAAKKTEVVVEA